MHDVYGNGGSGRVQNLVFLSCDWELRLGSWFSLSAAAPGSAIKYSVPTGDTRVTSNGILVNMVDNMGRITVKRKSLKFEAMISIHR